MARMSKTAPAKVNASFRRREAAELRARKLTWSEVADQMGISESRARQLYDEFNEQFRTENKALAEAIRDEQLNEIRLIKHTLLPMALDPNTSQRTVDTYVRLMAHEASITGAKTATEVKTTLQGPDGGPIQTAATTIDLTKVDTDRLQMLHAMLQDLQAQAGSN